MDDFWSTLDYTIFDSEKAKIEKEQAAFETHPSITTTTTGRVTGVRLSSATSDGTASPVPYHPTTTAAAAVTAAASLQKINNVNVINSSSSSTAATVDNHHLQHHLQTQPQQQQNSLQPPAVVDSNEPLSIKIKEEHLDDYERLIDNLTVNNDRHSKNLGSSSSSLRNSNSGSLPSPAVVAATTTANQQTSSRVSFTNEFVEYAVKVEPRLSIDSTTTAAGATSSSQQPPNTSYSHSESRDSGISVKTEMALDDVSPFSMGLGLGLGTDNVYDEFLSDLDKHWLHFRPKTPSSPVLPSSPPINTAAAATASTTAGLDDPGLDLFGSLDMPNHEEAVTRLLRKPFSVELQALDSQLPSEIFAVNEDSFFVTPEPVVLDALLIDDSAINKVVLNAGDGSKDSGDEVNTSSGDSLNELSLGLNESNDDEKLLANILEECQMEDAKVLTQTSNFWNGLLEENTLPTQLELDDHHPVSSADSSKFDRTIGYRSDVSMFTRRRRQSVADENGADADDESATTSKKKRRKLSSKSAARIGHSHFKVSSSLLKFNRTTPELLQLDPIKLEAVIKDEVTTLDPIAAVVDSLTTTGGTTTATTSSTTGIQIKSEPMDQDQSGSGGASSIDLLQSRIQLQKQTSSEAMSVQQHLLQQQQHHHPQEYHLRQIHIKQEHVSSADATAAHDYAASPSNMPPNAVQQVISAVSSTSSPTTTLTARIPPQQQNRLQAYITTSDAASVFSGSTTTVRQMNGPAGEYQFCFNLFL